MRPQPRAKEVMTGCNDGRGSLSVRRPRGRPRGRAGPPRRSDAVLRGRHHNVAMNEGNEVQFRDWLTVQLRARRMSLRQLAHRSGVNVSTVSRIVRGERRPTLRTAVRLA